MKRYNFLTIALSCFLAVHIMFQFSVSCVWASSGENQNSESQLKIWDGTVAACFERGSGSEDDPFIIKTPQQLAYLAQIVNSKTSSDFFYKLADNIYLNNTQEYDNWGTVAPANNWIPIGFEKSDFDGTFDGDGYSIFGLYIDSSSDLQGLFGKNNGIIENVIIEESYISGNDYVGGICAVNKGTIYNCIYNGNIKGNEITGGICGANESVIMSCINKGTVTGMYSIGGVCGGDFYSYYNDSNSIKTINCRNFGAVNGKLSVGGICGKYEGFIINCFNYGDVIAQEHAGGICGWAVGTIEFDISETISGCFNSGAVFGKTYAGGICGQNESQIIDSYNTGNVSGITDIGGLCGVNSGKTETCYNTGTVTGSSSVGSLDGSFFGVSINCYYKKDCAKDETGIIQNGTGNEKSGFTTEDEIGSKTGLTESKLKGKESFFGFDFLNIWTIEPASGYAYPQFIITLDKSYGEYSALWKGEIASGFESGNGTFSEPYLIKNAEQLAYFSEFVGQNNGCKDLYFKLSDDIYLNDNTKKNWILNANVWVPVADFYGTFDGDGHSIYGIYTDNYSDFQGLFERNHGYISNVVIESSFVCGNFSTGAICAVNCGTIDSCINSSTVKGIEDTGGISGGNYGQILSCINNGTVSGYYQTGGVCADSLESALYDNINNGIIKGDHIAGGIVGIVYGDYGKIFDDSVTENCSNHGIVTGRYYIGGIVGSNYCLIENCNNSGSVSGISKIGGICGETLNAMRYCYSCGTVSGISSIGGLLGSFSGSKYIEYCYNTGTVIGTGTDIGGLVGYARGISIMYSYNTGTIIGDYDVGGLVGYTLECGSDIVNCYNSGNIAGNMFVGGIQGSALWDATISQCYTVGTVSGEDGVGSILGGNSSDGHITECYYLKNSITLINSSSEYITDDIPGSVTSLTDEQMRVRSSYTGFDFSDTWIIGAQNAYPYPTLAYNVEAYTVTWIVNGKEFKELYVEDAVPEFSGKTDKEDTYCYYVFEGWDTEPVPVKADVTYVAQYSSIAKAVLGDVNRDGIIDSRDASLIQEYVVKAIVFKDDQLLTADVSGDGVISARDAVMILQYEAKKPVQFAERKD